MNGKKSSDKEPSLSNKANVQSPPKDVSSVTTSKPSELNINKIGDKELERVGKRKRNEGTPSCVRKRRGPLCPQKLNTVNPQDSKAMSLSKNQFVQTLPIDVKNNFVHTKRAQSCPKTIEKEEVDDRVLELIREKEELLSKNSVLEKQLQHHKVLYNTTCKKLYQAEESVSSCREKLIEVLRQVAVMERKLREEKLVRDCRLVGRIVQRQNSMGTHVDVWENGEKFKDLQVERQRLREEMKDLVHKKKELSQLKKKLRKNSGTSPGPDISPYPSTHVQFAQPQTVESVIPLGETHYCVQTEVYSLQTQNLKRKQSELEQAFKELKLLKHQHIKFIKIMNSEKKSLYQCKLLNDRYLCTGLIGRGGFSEVWKGYDLESHRYVACKIHSLNDKWTDLKKENFTRHATREAQIQMQLCHPRIVQLYDVFGIDVNTFCTVLELCEGMDLDAYLKANGPLNEREARSIITQLFEGLMYLAQQKQPIIHYDLKPGNILHTAGQIKITDFGLSKIMQKDQFEMELTSQGAGTYWYLPPECFIRSQDPPMIGTGVDMWSGGCLLYEMLFGRRPFGHNMSQEKIMREGTILQVNQVEFPVTPRISDEAKDLIQKCLSRNHKDRPDPLTILDTHPYFSKMRPART